MNTKPVAALVISGFLGSGKTTMVRHLLAAAQAEGVTVAVVSNEFGELGIDADLLGEGGRAFVELEGGCVCCQLSNELLETLQMLRERVDPDRIIIETSGVALPYDTQIQLWREPVRRWISDDLAVVVVNAEQVWESRDLEGTFHDQVTSADLLILNKTDLVDECDLAAVEARVRSFEPEAPIVSTAHGQVDPAVLFVPDRAPSRRRDSAPPHRHEQFRSREMRFAPAAGEDEIVAAVRAAGALRAKGFVHTACGVRLLQGVGARVELQPVAFDPPPEKLGRIVLIERPP